LSAVSKRVKSLSILMLLAAAGSVPLMAQGEAELKLPDLSTVSFFGGISGPTLLMGGLVISVLGLVFGLMMYTHLRNLPVHESMLKSQAVMLTCRRTAPQASFF
jgi:K(+)-stimulated pyrophosphate-energized sodium pump